MLDMKPSTEGRINCWPDAVQYLLTSYVQDKDIMVAVQDLRYTKQKPEKDDKQFSAGGLMLLAVAVIYFHQKRSYNVHRRGDIGH